MKTTEAYWYQYIAWRQGVKQKQPPGTQLPPLGNVYITHRSPASETITSANLPTTDKLTIAQIAYIRLTTAGRCERLFRSQFNCVFRNTFCVCVNIIYT